MGLEDLRKKLNKKQNKPEVKKPLQDESHILDFISGSEYEDVPAVNYQGPYLEDVGHSILSGKVTNKSRLMSQFRLNEKEADSWIHYFWRIGMIKRDWTNLHDGSFVLQMTWKEFDDKLKLASRYASWVLYTKYESVMYPLDWITCLDVINYEMEHIEQRHTFWPHGIAENFNISEDRAKNIYEWITQNCIMDDAGYGYLVLSSKNKEIIDAGKDFSVSGYDNPYSSESNDMCVGLKVFLPGINRFPELNWLGWPRNKAYFALKSIGIRQGMHFMMGVQAVLSGKKEVIDRLVLEIEYFRNSDIIHYESFGELLLELQQQGIISSYEMSDGFLMSYDLAKSYEECYGWLNTVIFATQVLEIAYLLSEEKTDDSEEVKEAPVNNNMSGQEFEQYCKWLLSKNGFSKIQDTPVSGDRGVDLIAYKDDVKYAIQCKRYSGNVGNKAVQEAYSGKGIYDADIAVVMTNSTFTSQAIEDAKRLRVKLWDGTYLSSMEKPKRNTSFQNNSSGNDIVWDYDVFDDMH